jgi:FkbM family methyltransferase
MGIKHWANSFWQQQRFTWSSNNSYLFKLYYKYIYSPKKGSLPAFLDVYSRHTKPFRVIQVGANDGITHDLIHKFIKRDQWQGVLLEPQAKVFNRLNVLYHKDQGIHTLQAALGETSGEAALYKIGFSNARWATGLASFDRSVIEQAFTSGYIKEKAAAEGIAVPGAADEQIITETIRVVTPAELAEEFGLPAFDLLQIDTEGFDADVVRIFSKQGMLPDAVVYEFVHLSNEKQEACIQLLQNEGFYTRAFGKDILAVKGRARHLFENQFSGS